MDCIYCNEKITESQNKAYEGCCDDICLDRYKRKNKNHCMNCGILITEENVMYGGFCSGGCAGEYSER